MSWSTSELRVRLAPLNRFKPSSKIFNWPFQDGTSFVDLLCFCTVLCLLCLCVRLFICALWSPAGKGMTSWLSFVVSAVSLSLSHWFPGSGVVLDCIDSWSLHTYLLLCMYFVNIFMFPYEHNRTGYLFDVNYTVSSQTNTRIIYISSFKLLTNFLKITKFLNIKLK